MLFGTATHSLTLTALKSDLLKVSKSTKSVNSGSICTLEKSIFSSTAGAACAESVSFFDFEEALSASRDLIVGSFFALAVKVCKMICISLNHYNIFFSKLY